VGRKSRRGSAPRARRPRAGGVVVALAVAIGVAVWVRRERAPRDVPEPPRPTVRLTEDGVRVATWDVAALAEWCRAADLPAPPGLREAEPAVADGLREALLAAAVQRDAASFGRVGQIAESLDAHEAAEAYFRLAAAADASDFRWPYYLGCVYQETGRRDDAIAELERAAALGPAYPTTAARLGQLYLEAGRADEARAQFERYDAMRPDDWFGLVGLARLALDAGEADRALELLGRAAERGPDDFQVNFQLGRAWAAIGDRERAREHFARAEVAPQGGWFRMRDPLVDAMHDAASSVGELQVRFERLSAAGDFAAMVEVAEEIVRRRSGDVRMLGNLAGLYRKLGRFDDAHAALDRALALGTDRIRLQNLRAEILLAEKRFDDAIAATDSVLALSPGDARAASARARALTMLERWDEAETWMRKSLDVEPADVSNRIVLAEILLGRDRAGEAAAEFRAVLAADPGNAYARARLAQIEGGG